MLRTSGAERTGRGARLKFAYKGVASDGKMVNGVVEAHNQYEALEQLRANGVTCLDMSAEAAAADRPGHELKSARFEIFGVSQATVAFFTRQLFELTDAGIPILQSLESLQRLSPSGQFKDVLGQVARDVRAGEGFHDALARHPQVFDTIYLSMIQAGEASGNLPMMVGKLADLMEADMEVRGKIKSALTYPVFILIFSLLVVWAMVALLLPGFEPMWTQSGLDLNQYPITLMLMKISSMTHSLVDEVLLALLVGATLFGLRQIVRTPQGSLAVDRLMWRIPLFGGFVQMSVMSRIANTLGTLVESGIPLVRSMELAGATGGNLMVRQAMVEAARKLQAGSDLETVFGQAQVFPPLMLQMISIGEQSGSLGHMLPRVGTYYRRQLDTAIKGFSSLVEPLMMILVGGVVFLLVLGVFMPIMGIVGALQKQM